MQDFKSMIDYFLLDMTDPVNIIPVTILLFCFTWSGLPQGPEKYTAIWVLFNAAFIHIWMDGVIGVLGRGPRWMVVEYTKLDKRFPQKDPAVMALVCGEAFIMAPLCILWYDAIMKKLWYEPFLAILTSTFQMFGSLIFAFAEVFVGFRDLPKLHSWPPSFTVWSDLFYFWFVFVFCNIVWTALPTFIIIKSIMIFSPNNNNTEKKRR